MSLRANVVILLIVCCIASISYFAHSPTGFEVVEKRVCTAVVGKKMYQPTFFGYPVGDPEKYFVLKDGREIERHEFYRENHIFMEVYCETVYVKKD